MNTAKDSVLRGNYPQPQFVSQDVLNILLQDMKDLMDSEEMITGARFERVEAIMGKNMAELKGEINGLRAELKVINERIDKNLVEHKAATSGVRGDVKALGASIDSFQHWRNWDIAWGGIIIGAVIGLIQMFLKVR